MKPRPERVDVEWLAEVLEAVVACGHAEAFIRHHNRTHKKRKVDYGETSKKKGDV